MHGGARSHTDARDAWTQTGKDCVRSYERPAPLPLVGPHRRYIRRAYLILRERRSRDELAAVLEPELLETLEVSDEATHAAWCQRGGC